jgi:hypothetical protein
MLCNLDTASLSQLLTIKKLPGRSKIKTKPAKIDALEGLVTMADIVQVTGVKHAGTIEESDIAAPRAIAFDLARRQVQPREGARFDMAEPQAIAFDLARRQVQPREGARFDMARFDMALSIYGR